MRGSHTLLFIGVGSLLLLAFAWKKNGGSGTGTTETPGNSATAGTTPSKPTPSKPTVQDPEKKLVGDAKKLALGYGRAAVDNWFKGHGAP